MLRITALAATAALLTAPAFAMGCNYGSHSSASADASAYVPEYSPTAATATTVEPVTPLQSTPIDANAVVYESDAIIETVEPVIIPEG